MKTSKPSHIASKIIQKNYRDFPSRRLTDLPLLPSEIRLLQNRNLHIRKRREELFQKQKIVLYLQQ